MLICYSLGMNNLNNYPAPVLPKLVLSVIGAGAGAGAGAGNGNGTGTATYPRAAHSDYCTLACVCEKREMNRKGDRYNYTYLPTSYYDGLLLPCLPYLPCLPCLPLLPCLLHKSSPFWELYSMHDARESNPKRNDLL
ncbi:predicted protein [Botrytis cinerea T4]|uniref:Uncharacterized protein n=1 Tax=Botryotinia fuckeliana (strain T4) TaxID=999810 RepID=G2YDK7_BOTF4|nr:predicted protein [Botrytis cinerea T4]